VTWWDSDLAIKGARAEAEPDPAIGSATISVVPSDPGPDPGLQGAALAASVPHNAIRATSVVEDNMMRIRYQASKGGKDECREGGKADDVNPFHEFSRLYTRQ